MIDIYLITNKINGKQYVGKTQKGYKVRFKQHCNAYNHGYRNYISCAIHKYGADNFTTELITQVADDTWEYWENYYIKYFKTHYTQGGYNVTWGGDSNPMDIPTVKEKHKQACNTPEFKEKQRKHSLNEHHTEQTKQLCRENTLNNLDVCIARFRQDNESKKIRIGMIVDNKIVKEFDSASDACEYCGRPRKEAGNLIKKGVDKFKKNGERAKFYGYSWTLL